MSLFLLNCKIKKYLSHLILAIALTLLILFQNGCASFSIDSNSLPTIEEANQAVAQMDLERSRKILQVLSENNGVLVKDKVKAFQILALQDWRFYQDINSAKEKLHKADSLGFDRSGSRGILSRIECEAENYSAAQTDAKKAEQMAEKEEDVKNAKINFARAVHDQAIQSFKNGYHLNISLLLESSNELKNILQKEPGEPSASELLLGISLLLNNGTDALLAWRSYFWISSKDTVTGILSKSAGELAMLLQNWNNRPLTKIERKSLVLNLAASRFYDYASMIATDPLIPQDEKISDVEDIHEIILYDNFIFNVKNKTEKFYLATATGGGNNGLFSKLISFFRDYQFDNMLNNEAQQFWEKLSFNGERPSFDEDRFREEMEKRFGLIWRHQGYTNGYHDLLAGHIVSEDRHTVEQYSHKAEVHYVWIDRMISAGYSSWFWDYQAMVGGWTINPDIYLIRPAFIYCPFYFWSMVTDPKKRNETEKYIEERKAVEDSITQINPYASLPGLRSRLVYECYNNKLNILKLKNLNDQDLRLAFFSESMRFYNETVIAAHEGRHAIDQKFFPGKFDSPELEYRAKLSQVVFSSDPKLAFSDLISSYLGDSSPHGQADLQIMKTVVAWMGKNVNEISGVDKNKPLLPQFYLLTDDQVRKICIEADPLAKSKLNEL